MQLLKKSLVIAIVGLTFLLHAERFLYCDEIDFEKDIWPIFQSRCNDCHNEDSQEGQLRLDARTAFIDGGVSGKLVDRENVEQSLLLTRILGKGDLDRMPLDEDPLTEEQVQKIKSWLLAGAKWPDHVGQRVKSKESHWAYQAPLRPGIPALNSTWPVNPIDHFVLKQMNSRGLHPNEPAEKSKLLRRLYLDLTGLPPSLEQLEAYLADPSSLAYEKVVDQLLASPGFGEKWSRSWLDLARYADTNGFQADQFRSVWPYRDWVIRAINQDMSFAQFTIEQLAGDLIPNATTEQKIATGFHRLTTCNVEAGVDPEQNRVNQIFDRLNTTGTVWFGTTFECMQCHNHKYDPFTQKEYYQMFAFFNNTPIEVKNSGNDIQYEFYGPKMDLPPSPELQQQTSKLQQEKKKLELELARISKARETKFQDWLKAAKSRVQQKEKWIPLRVTKFQSVGGAGHRVLPDHSVLLQGKNPDKDSYEFVVESDLPQINGFRIDTLTHPTLPGKGPGRHALQGHPNFVVHELTASVVEPSGKSTAIELVEAQADFSQKNYPVAGLIDGKLDTGWAINPEFGKNHWASFLTKHPLQKSSVATRVRFTLDHRYGGGRNIGRLRISALVGSRNKPGLPPGIAKLIQAKKLNGTQKQKLREHFLTMEPDYKKLTAQLNAVQKKLASIQPDSTLVMIESDRRETAVFKRGNFLDRGEVVKPDTPATLHDVNKQQLENRLDFARWIVDKNNPLTARVVVNRWWMEIFGRGIVSTAEDFGTQGEFPSHPQLLDWLAVEFMESGWSRKHVIRKIVLSQTYRQSSVIRPANLAKDPSNTFLSRGPRFRMSAEMIRDNFLVVSDNFASQMGGPPIYPPQPDGIWRHVGRNAPKYQTSQGTDRYRRGLYVFWRRSAPYPSFVNFDAPDRASCVVNRPKTNTPLQALTLLNDQATFELCREYAMHLHSLPQDDTEKITTAFRTCTMRNPSQQELKFLVRLLGEREKYYDKEPLKANALSDNPSQASKKAAWVNLVQILFNLDESITKD